MLLLASGLGSFFAGDSDVFVSFEGFFVLGGIKWEFGAVSAIVG